MSNITIVLVQVESFMFFAFVFFATLAMASTSEHDTKIVEIINYMNL